MRRIIIGSIAALAILLGLAAPASADLGIQATVGNVWATTDGTGTSVNLVDNVLNTCLLIGINAQSGVKNNSSRTVVLYDNLGDCINGATGLTLTTTFQSFSTKMAYKVS